MTQLDDDTTLVLKRTFAASPEALFDAWSVQAEWQAWIGPEGIDCEVPLMEPRVGGRYRIVMHMAGGRDIRVAGVFKAIERPVQLVFTWGWEADAGRQSLITITLAATTGGTELTLRQEGLGTPRNRDDHVSGWTATMNKLERYLAA
jgi:uncharacterized protein YndB with AHSA1/START domain